MRFKLDENLPVELANVLRDAGHDAGFLESIERTKNINSSAPFSPGTTK